MRYSSNAPAIAYAALGTKLFVLGAVLLLIAGCLLGIGHLIIELFSPIATKPSGVLTVHGNYVAAAIALGAIGGIAVIAGIAINSKLPASKKLRARVRAGIFDPRFGNPLHLRDGEVVPRVVCKETEAGRFEISISTLSSTVDEVAKLAECISARLCGRFSRYAVVLTEADVASNHVTFFVQDVTLHHEIEADTVEEMSPPSAYELRVQDGTNIDLRTSGSMLVAGKTRSGKTTGVIALLIQALLSGPDEYGSQVLIIDPKQAELSRLPHVVSLGPDGDATRFSRRLPFSLKASRSGRASSTTALLKRGTRFIGGMRDSMSLCSSWTSTWRCAPCSPSAPARRTPITASPRSTDLSSAS